MPVSLEFVFMLVLNFVNQVVVGALGATAIAAVGFANSLTLILLLTLGGLGASVSILVARAHGAGRRSELDRTVSTALLISVGAASLVAAPLVLWARTILSGTGASATVAAAGAAYFQITTLALVPSVLGAVLSGVMRSLGHARRPMVATIVTVALNAVLGYALVFGVGPMPTMGVAGAGWATLIAALLKLAILLVQVYGRAHLVRWRYPTGWLRDRRSWQPLIVLALPLAVTELCWSTGTFLYNVVVQRLGDNALAAAQIVNTLEAIFIVGSIGLMSATTALVGRSIGQGDAAAAVAWARRVLRAGVATGVLFGLLFATSALLLSLLYPDVAESVRSAAGLGIVINAAFQVVKVRNMIVGAGILPSGSDTRGVILGDAVAAFAVGLPLAIGLGLFTPLGIIGVFAARIIEELVKAPIFAMRARKLPWQALADEQRHKVAAA